MIDIRDRVAFADEHLAGALSINLSAQFATYLGWLFPLPGRVTLLGPSASDIADARRQLARIGIEELEMTCGPMADIAPAEHPRRSYPRRTFDDMAAGRADGDAILDVRRYDEHDATSLPEAIRIPLHELRERIGELPLQRLWIHCLSGFRAGTAASLLANAGFDVVHVDDHLEHAAELGLTAPVNLS